MAWLFKRSQCEETLQEVCTWHQPLVSTQMHLQHTCTWRRKSSLSEVWKLPQSRYSKQSHHGDRVLAPVQPFCTLRPCAELPALTTHTSLLPPVTLTLLSCLHCSGQCKSYSQCVYSIRWAINPNLPLLFVTAFFYYWSLSWDKLNFSKPISLSVKQN